ncbi:hypothetical protein STRIP9103_07974 [Streptomyces ipomoeae 91-03]|uniref:Uncharacterized protein n=1 Tax=Streptomyces ipomoeae 91-03 TaxID=698759 RepID=L1KQ02_9ACTN|nr:hypothetical protein STRIP9103_07974 [Streptomyces ipomoeae 91-03]
MSRNQRSVRPGGVLMTSGRGWVRKAGSRPGRWPGTFGACPRGPDCALDVSRRKQGGFWWSPFI